MRERSMSAIIEIVAVIIVLIILVWAILVSLRIVRPTEKGLVDDFGKYHRFVEEA